MKIRFSETIEEQAARLATARNFVRIRRYALRQKMLNAPVTWKDVPYEVEAASIENLLRTLQLNIKNDEGGVIFVPAPGLETAELREGQMIKLSSSAGIKIGGEGLSRQTLRPPFGYRNVGGIWHAEQPAARAILAAFTLINEWRGQGQRGGCNWKAVAAALNEQGHSRRDGNNWTGDDVRSLIRAPTYAGYVKQIDRPLYRDAQLIPQPLIAAKDFYMAALNGEGRKGMEWLVDLGTILRQQGVNFS